MTHDHEATWDTDIPIMITFQKTKKDRQFRVGNRPEGEIVIPPLHASAMCKL